MVVVRGPLPKARNCGKRTSPPHSRELTSPPNWGFRAKRETSYRRSEAPFATTRLHIRPRFAGRRPSFDAAGFRHCTDRSGGAGTAGGSAIGPAIVRLVAIGAGILLIAGLWTPITGGLVTAIELLHAFSQPGDPLTHILLATLGAALALRAGLRGDHRAEQSASRRPASGREAVSPGPLLPAGCIPDFHSSLA